MILNIIDNFLSEKTFNDISNIIMDDDGKTNFMWHHVANIENITPPSKKFVNLFYMVHLLYNLDHDEEYKDSFYEILDPIFSALVDMGIIKCWRVKCNLYPNTETLREHAYHTDNKESHIAAIYALNTCDGYTKFKDGTKVDSIANRMYFFDGGIEHASTTTTNVPARFNINFNFAHSVESWRKNE